MERIHNFSAGPAVLPREVLEQASDELMNWHGCGMSVMEMSHRGKEFTTILEAAEADLRDLMKIPANYKVLFLQGGATLQFAQVPLNLMAGRSADYLVTGDWSKKAYKEAQRYGDARLVASTEAEGFTRFPAQAEMDLDPDAAYLHVCTNETIRGVEAFDEVALPASVPLVADMSSHILSRPMDVSRYGLIYAGAQKNVGPAGVCLVIVREDLLGHASVHTPTLLDYAIQAEHVSMLNTPPTFAIYMAGLVFKWLLDKGGVAAMERINVEKARRLYDAIDGSGGFYRNPVAMANRSRMNVPFTLHDPRLDEAFIAEARGHGIVQIKGHKSVGGMRASIYNAMPVEGVQALVDFMADFGQRHG
ncbi:MAG: 3-phosphoserine/phosphohydroxythreonine transaminase [Gallionellaceae bacterium]|nr:3-phosphoserine/phosphohydroxythreonine transaminase [Gallionellaceae bacterium]